MYETAKTFIESELPIKDRIKLFPIFSAGIKAYNDIISSDYDFFKSKYSANIYGDLKTFVIYRQFDSDMLSDKFPFKCTAKVVNSFKYTVPELSKGKGVFLIGRTKKAEILPKSSQYKLKYCKNNTFQGMQLKIDIDDNKELSVGEGQYLAFITYGIKNSDLNFINIVVPDNKMEECLYCVDLKNEFEMYSNNVEEDREQEEQIIATLKDKWVKSHRSS